MKKNILLIAGLMLAAQTGVIAQIDTGQLSLVVQDEREWVRSENDIDEAALSQMSFDAFLSGSGYVVYPVEEDIAVLQAKITKNPMILHKQFIPRRVRVLRQVTGQSAESSRNRSPKQFAIVSEIGSASIFMVNKKDLHFVQNEVREVNEAK